MTSPDGDLEWLTSRPAPEGFYGMNAFMKSIDTMLLGRKTYEVSLRMGAKFDSKSRTIVFSRHLMGRKPFKQPAGNPARRRRNGGAPTGEAEMASENAR